MKIIDKIGKIFSIILVSIIGILIIFNIYSYICLNVLNNDYVSILGYTYFEVASGSMEPTIEKQDVVVVKLNEEYGNDDIITFIDNGDFITHRVKEMRDNTVLTMGDANNVSDALVDKANVIGKVVYIIPHLGIWKQVLLTPKVLILICLTMIVFTFTFSFDKKIVDAVKTVRDDIYATKMLKIINNSSDNLYQTKIIKVTDDEDELYETKLIKVVEDKDLYQTKLIKIIDDGDDNV